MRRKEVRPSFFEKKEAKKLLFVWSAGGSCSVTKFNKSFFACFFSNKEGLAFL